MATTPLSPRVAWAGAQGGDVLEHLTVSLASGGVRTGWREDVLADLAQLRDVLITERAERSSVEGCAVLRERSHLLSELALQRLQVMASPDVDRLAYDLRRLASQVRAHLRRGQDA